MLHRNTPVTLRRVFDAYGTGRTGALLIRWFTEGTLPRTPKHTRMPEWLAAEPVGARSSKAMLGVVLGVGAVVQVVGFLALIGAISL